jgi:hypothetical protein
MSRKLDVPSMIAIVVLTVAGAVSEFWPLLVMAFIGLLLWVSRPLWERER